MRTVRQTDSHTDKYGDWRAGRHDEGKSRFAQFCERTEDCKVFELNIYICVWRHVVKRSTSFTGSWFVLQQLQEPSQYLTLMLCKFCSQNTDVFLYTSEQTATIHLYSINWFL